MGTSPVYDEIGRGYAVARRPDPRIARAIAGALADARSVVNVGAGAGSCEPSHLRVTAVEPSPEMLRQRPRVARRRVVILTWDPSCRDLFWLMAEYLPAMLDLDVPRFPPLPDIARCFTAMDAYPVLVPHDCVDGFLGAFWRRPDAYLDPGVRRGISSFAQLPSGAIEEGLARLAADLAEGRWDARFGHLRSQDNADLGYRLIVGEPGR